MHQHLHGVGRRVPMGIRKDDKSVAIAVNGPRVVNDMEMSILAAIDSVGLAFSFEELRRAAPREWRTRERARGLVPTIRGFLLV
jgi:hypothetical protein